MEIEVPAAKIDEQTRRVVYEMRMPVATSENGVAQIAAFRERTTFDRGGRVVDFRVLRRRKRRGKWKGWDTVAQTFAVIVPDDGSQPIVRWRWGRNLPLDALRFLRWFANLLGARLMTNDEFIYVMETRKIDPKKKPLDDHFLEMDRRMLDDVKRVPPRKGELVLLDQEEVELIQMIGHLCPLLLDDEDYGRWLAERAVSHQRSAVSGQPSAVSS